MRNFIERGLEAALAVPFCFGQILVRNTGTGGFVLTHRDDEFPNQLETFRDAQDAIEIAKYDDAGNYRPLKSAPSLRHGWRLELATIEQLKRALDYFYPARLAIFAVWKNGELKTTPLRQTLDRQSGMYRVAAKISDAQIDDVVANFCRSDGGCLRTILWKRDNRGTIASTKLPKEKFDPASDQTRVAPIHEEKSGCDVPKARRAVATGHSHRCTVPLLCQEACNLLVAECRKTVKDENV